MVEAIPLRPTAYQTALPAQADGVAASSGVPHDEFVTAGGAGSAGVPRTKMVTGVGGGPPGTRRWKEGTPRDGRRGRPTGLGGLPTSTGRAPDRVGRIRRCDRAVRLRKRRG